MRVTISQIKEMKQRGDKIAMLTACDYSMAKIIDVVGIPLVLVGDSLGMTVLGYETTIPVTMQEMLHHTKAVVRGSKRAMVIGDMPFMTYHINTEDAIGNAARFIQEGGAQAVKLEGGLSVADKVKSIVSCGIPVMGHIGLIPQSIHQLGGFKAQGKTLDAAKGLIKDAEALEEAGAFAIVLETIPVQLAKVISQKVSIPTIGIGAGKDCDGQVLVYHDLVGLFERFTPKFVKQYVNLSLEIKEALIQFKTDVEEGTFPGPEHTFSMKQEEAEKI